MAKAQITIFAILAIILLFAFGFIYYIASSESQNQLKEGEEAIESVNLAKSEIEERIQSCMYEGAVSAIKLLGQQGGVYYKDQEIDTKYGNFYLEGLDDELDFDTTPWRIENDGKNYTVFLKQRGLDDYTGTDVFEDRVYFTPHHYPCRSQLTNSLLGKDIIRDWPDCEVNYELENSIESISTQLDWPNLCNRNIPEGCTTDCICECNGVYCERSVMNELEDYVSKYFDLCFRNYESTGYENSYRENIDNNITSYVGLSNIHFILNSQINFTSTKGDAVLIFNDVKSENIDLKLASFFNDAFSTMINKDGVVSNYNLTFELEAYKGFKDLKVEQIPLYTSDAPPNNKYHMMKLTLFGVDGQLKGRPFDFIFLRENRIPVLENIKRVQIPGDKRRFNITYRSADPDEDKRIFRWDYMGTAEELVTVENPDDSDAKITLFRSKLDPGTTGTMRLTVCDVAGLCDYQIIQVRQN